MKYIKVQGIVYSELGMYGGNVHLGRIFDLNNEVAKTGCIWNMQPWEYKPKQYSIGIDFLRWCLSIYVKNDTWSKTVVKTKKLTELIYN